MARRKQHHSDASKLRGCAKPLVAGRKQHSSGTSLQLYRREKRSSEIAVEFQLDEPKESPGDQPSITQREAGVAGNGATADIEHRLRAELALPCFDEEGLLENYLVQVERKVLRPWRVKHCNSC